METTLTKERILHWIEVYQHDIYHCNYIIEKAKQAKIDKADAKKKLAAMKKLLKEIK